MADKKSREVIIGGGRKVGKTTELIKKAHEEQLYILCPNRQMAEYIFKRAKEIGLDIPYPITIEDLPLKSNVEEVLVDEAENVLSQLIRKRIVGMSTSMEIRKMQPYTMGVDMAKDEPIIKIKADVNDTITGLKAVQREARNTSKALRELESQQRKNKHLVIEVDKLGDVPKVYHKGNEISKKESIRFEWDTANGRYQSRTKIGIDYYEADDKGLVKKGIHELKGPRENEVCPVCGSDIKTITLRADGEELYKRKVCTKCESDIDD